MATFNLPKDIVRLDTGRTFVPLGQPNLIFTPSNRQLNEAVSFRVRGITEGRVNGFWGTLGRSDDLPVDWEGTLYCSGTGNDASTGDVGRIVDAIRQAQTSGGGFNSEPVLEKYIAFDEVEFGNTPASRNLRLTVMLNPGEAVIMFYHHGESGSKTQTGAVEYILPAEGNMKSTLPSRKTFVFEVPVIAEAHNDVDEDNVAIASRFLVKALVFKYPEEGVEKREQYALVKYNRDKDNGFDVIDANAIDFTKKTLFIIHGTFATTEVSFRGLHKSPEDKSSLLQKLLDPAVAPYEQIIGFDHKTVAHDTLQNISELKQRLAAANPNWKFTQTVDIIATSRGGLVAKTLAGDPELNSPAGRMRVDKIIFASCPNGAALLDPKSKTVMRIVLSAIASLSGPLSPVFVSVFQMGATAIFNSPGLKVQTGESPELKQILDLTPQWDRTRYYPICGDLKPEKKKFWDFIIDAVLKDPNDWVNYTSRMNQMPVNKLAYKRAPEYFLATERLANAIHTEYFTTPGETRPAKYIEEFLTDKTDAWL